MENKTKYERLLEDLSKQQNRSKEDILQDAIEDYCEKQSKSTIQKSLDEILQLENAQLGYLRSIAIMTKSPEVFENIKDVNEEINRLFESGKV